MSANQGNAPFIDGTADRARPASTAQRYHDGDPRWDPPVEKEPHLRPIGWLAAMQALLSADDSESPTV